MDRRGKWWMRAFLVVSALSVVGAVIALVFQLNLIALGQVAGVAIVLTAVGAVSAPYYRGVSRATATSALVVVLLVGTVAELIGLTTGVFGQYVYTIAWKPFITIPDVGRFPLMLPFCWFILVAACRLAVGYRFAGVPAVFLAALLTTAVDFVMEPVLTGPVGFWIWQDDTPCFGAPWLNPVFWFLTSLGAGAVIQNFVPDPEKGPEGALLLSAVLLGTAAIGATHGELRGLAALVLLPVVLWLNPLREKTTSR